MLISNRSILEALYASGWAEDRQVEIDSWVRELEAAGYGMNGNAREVLSSLGGLTIQPMPSDSQVYQPLPVRLEPLLLKWLTRPTDWERELGITLSPLGHSSLFIGDDARLYVSWDAILECLGEDCEDSLSTLLFAKKRGRRIKLQNQA